MTGAACAAGASDRTVFGNLQRDGCQDRDLDRLPRERDEARRSARQAVPGGCSDDPATGTADVIRQLTGFGTSDALPGRDGDRDTAKAARIIAAAAAAHGTP